MEARDPAYADPFAAVIDMTSINNGTFNGWLEFTIARGRTDLFRVSDELNGGVGVSSDAASMSQWGFGASTFGSHVRACARSRARIAVLDGGRRGGIGSPLPPPPPGVTAVGVYPAAGP